MKNNNRERILQIIEGIDNLKKEIDVYHQELKSILKETEEEKFATSREINKLPTELQETPQNIIAIHKLLSTENKLKSSLDCFFNININIYKMTQILKEMR